MSRRPNNTVRSREYLTPDEVARLLEAVDGPRNQALLLLMYRHGLRVSEAVGLRWDDLNLAAARINVRRLKHGRSSVQPLGADECEALARLSPPNGNPLVFGIRRFAIHRIVREAGRQAGFPWPVHPHMLRHACGYALANQGLDTRLIQDYLGHANIRHTVTYTALDAGRFNEIRWR